MAFAAAGSWIGAYITMTYLHGPPGQPPGPLNPSPMQWARTTVWMRIATTRP